MAWKAKINNVSSVTSSGTFEVSVDIIDTEGNTYPNYTVSGSTKEDIKGKLQAITDQLKQTKREKAKFQIGEEINL